jgi:putative membrane protein
MESGDRRLHPLAVVGTSLKSLPGALAGMIGSFTALMRQGVELAFGAAALILLIMVAAAFVKWWRFTYRIGEGEIVIQRGLFSRQRRVIPFDRVRDIAIEQPLIARLAGAARVRIETGGAKADEGTLDMIELHEAHALRDHIRRSNLAPAAAPVSLEQEEPPERTIFAMATPRVLGSGLLNFSLILIAVMIGAIQYLDELGLIDIERWIRTSNFKEVAGRLDLRVIATIALLLILVGVASGVIRTFLRDFGFQLTAGPAGLRRRRGLITLSEVLIPARRTEAARIETGWLSGWLGWHALAFQTLGADPKEGGVQVAAPFARMEEVERILREADFPLPPGSTLTRPPARALVRRCGPWLLLAPLAAGAGLVWPQAVWAGLAPLAVAAAGFLHWWRDGHLVGERALYISGGILGRRLWILPYEKLQTLSTARTPLQRALGLASVEPDVAGASLWGAPDVEDLRQPDAEALSARLLANFYSARSEVRRAAAQRH